jgi:hypothetical protein
MNTSIDSANEERTGLEDVTRAARSLARSTRKLGGSAAMVAERELAMAISIAEDLRDRTISRETLVEVRESELGARLRRDVHRAVDLVADTAGVLTVTTMNFFESLVDRPRPAIEGLGESVTGATQSAAAAAREPGSAKS